MPDPNLLDNRPLARAALWFLVDSGIVLVIICLLMLPDLIPDFFNHAGLHKAALIAMTLLFSLLATTSSVLGFLSNCRPGKTTGTIAIVVLIAGLGLIATMHFVVAAIPVQNWS